MKLKKSKPLYLQAKDALTENIRTMKAGNNRLPSEEELTKKLGVSRSTVREALHDLINEGLVSKRHGKGNFGHPAILDVPYRIDRDADFRRLLADSSKILTIESSPYVKGMATKKTLYRLPEFKGQEVYSWEWAYYLDDALYILVIMEIPIDYFVRRPVETDAFSLKDFVALFCEKDLAYYVSWINAQQRPEVAKRFASHQEVVQDWEEIYYDIEDHPIAFCEVFFNPDVMEVAIRTSL